MRTLEWMLVIAGLLTPLPALTAAAEAPPPLMLPKVYQAGTDLSDFWASEKYDGVRGYWDGERLLTRGGQRIAAPAWFTAGWPASPMDGELWAGRGRFAAAVSTVRQQAPDDAAWRGMRFMVFDLPSQGGVFTTRLTALRAEVAALAQPWVVPVEQTRITGRAMLQERLLHIVGLGGEGVMLHRGDSLYAGQRSDDLLKVKPHDDAEARVIAHLPGKGKYAGRLGALLVEMPGTDGRPGRRFRLGSGLTDAQRDDPPAVGTLVTYRFRGLNESGIPRFASFMRNYESGLN